MLVRLVNYSMAVGLAATGCLLYLQLSGQSTLTREFSSSYVEFGETLLIYIVIQELRFNDNLVNFLWNLLHPRRRRARP